MEKTYELMTISELKLGEEGARKVSNSVKDLITASKGKVLDNDFWGKGKLAYEIKHETEAFYDVIKFQMSSENMPEFKNKLNFIGGLTRYLVTIASSDNK